MTVTMLVEKKCWITALSVCICVCMSVFLLHVSCMCSARLIFLFSTRDNRLAAVKCRQTHIHHLRISLYDWIYLICTCSEWSVQVFFYLRGSCAHPHLYACVGICNENRYYNAEYRPKKTRTSIKHIESDVNAVCCLHL